MTRDRVVNLLLLQAASVVPLVEAGLGRRTLGIAIAWLAVLVQLAVVRFRRADLAIAAAAAALGVVGELLLVRAGMFSFTHVDTLGMPGWLAPSWALLGVSCGYLLVRLRGRMLASFAVGVVAGALALGGAVTAGEIVVRSSSRFAIAALAVGALLAAVSAAAASIERALARPPR